MEEKVTGGTPPAAKSRRDMVWTIVILGLLAVAIVAVGELWVLPHFKEKSGGVARARVEMKFGDEAKDAPDVPPPPNGEKIYGMAGGGRVYTNYATALPAEQVSAFYQKEMPARGWDLKKYSEGPEGKLLALFKERYFCQILVASESPGVTSVSVITAPKVEVDKAP